MTKNQLQYWANKETARSNQAREQETKRNNMANLAELERHNKALEQGTLSDQELRKYIAELTNAFNLSSLDETKRANLANEGIRTVSNNVSWGNLAELSRSNKAREYLNQQTINETNRHNQILEFVDKMNANTNRFNSDSAQQQADTQQERIDNDLFIGSISEILKAIQMILK